MVRSRRKFTFCSKSIPLYNSVHWTLYDSHDTFWYLYLCKSSSDLWFCCQLYCLWCSPYIRTYWRCKYLPPSSISLPFTVYELFISRKAWGNQKRKSTLLVSSSSRDSIRRSYYSSGIYDIGNDVIRKREVQPLFFYNAFTMYSPSSSYHLFS